MGVAGEHNLARANAARRRGDALAYPGRIDRKRLRMLEDAHPCRLRSICQAQRVVQGMDVKRVRKMERMKIMVGLEHFAHALDRPTFDLGSKLAVELDVGQHLVAVVDLGDFEPAWYGGDAGHARLGDGSA